MKQFVLKCWLTAAVMLLSASVFLIPSMIVSTIPVVQVGSPTMDIQQDTVTASGTLESTSQREIYLELPVIVEDVLVSVGDAVGEGDTLATIDVAATQKALAVQTVFGGMFGEIDKGDEQEITDALGEIAGLGILSGMGETEILDNFIEQYTGSVSEMMNLEEGILPSLTDVNSTIQAPIGGVVTKLSIKAKSPIGAYTAIATITPENSLSARLQVSEADAEQITIGQRVTLRGDGFSGQMVGEVVEIAPTATQKLNSSTLTQETVVDVLVSIDNAFQSAKEGYTITAKIETGVAERVWLAPYEAVRQDENNLEYVMTYQNGYAHKQLIATGGDLYDGVVVLAGLDRDTQLILEPDGLQDGQRVHLEGEETDG